MSQDESHAIVPHPISRLSWPFVIGVVFLVAAGLFIYGVSDILLPFVTGIIAAYFLDPAADALEEKGLSRTKATVIICCLFFGIIILLAVFLIPVIVAQGGEFIDKMPAMIDKAKNYILPQFEKISDKLDAAGVKGKNGDSAVSLEKAQNYALGVFPQFIKKVLLSGVALLNLMALIFITPIVTFYMLKDWDNIVACARRLLPPRYSDGVVSCVKDIDRILSGYIRGQTNVCMLLGLFYAASLWAAGLQYGLFIGMMTGIGCFLPYVGVALGMTAGLTLAVLQFPGEWLHIGVIAAIFIVGQFIEGNFITPKLVGDKVMLHPAWIIFALLAGGSLFGFLGVVLAVPVAAALGVCIRRGKDMYVSGAFYTRE